MDPKEVSQIINELGENREAYYNAVTPPIFQTSNFAVDTVAAFRKALEDESSYYIYTRSRNPTVRILEKKLAAMDGAEESLVLNSGSSAIFVAVFAEVQSGDHIVAVEHPYSWAQKLFDNILPRFNISVTYVDGRDVDNFRKAIKPNTRIIYLESPNSWNFYLQDLVAVAALAHEKGILTICDNSYATPLYQQPIKLGIDVAIQSATKFLNGHSDVVAGVISGSGQIINKIQASEYMSMGIGTPPFNAWLILRGLRTLSVRLQRISETTPKIIAYLKSSKYVESLSFPFDEDFEQYALAKKQMQGACGLFSFILKVDRAEQIEAFCDAMEHILMAVSWGGHESLIMPGVASIPRDDFDPKNEIHRRVRLYIGLEDPDYILEDLQKGFTALAAS